MKRVLLASITVAAMTATPALAISVDAQVEGPLLQKEGVLEYVKKNVKGVIANVPDLEQGGKHRLFVRVASKHIGPGSWYLYLTEVQLQRRVTDVETRRIYWASIRSAVLWGTVPTEIEVRAALGSLMSDKVQNWQAD
jgi:hypothetical protein